MFSVYVKIRLLIAAPCLLAACGAATQTENYKCMAEIGVLLTRHGSVAP